MNSKWLMFILRELFGESELYRLDIPVFHPFHLFSRGDIHRKFVSVIQLFYNREAESTPRCLPSPVFHTSVSTAIRLRFINQGPVATRMHFMWETQSMAEISISRESCLLYLALEVGVVCLLLELKWFTDIVNHWGIGSPTSWCTNSWVCHVHVRGCFSPWWWVIVR